MRLPVGDGRWTAACARRVAVLLAGLLGLSVAAPVAPAAATVLPAYPPPAWSAHLAADRALGEAEARALLGELVLPPGAIASATEPAGDSGLLLARDGEPGRTPAQVHAWFTAPGTTAEAIEYIHTHRPAGALVEPLPTPLVSDMFDGFSFPPSEGEISSKQLGVQVAQLPQGGVGLLASAYAYWLLPREQLPRTIRTVRVTVSEIRGLHGGGKHTYTITPVARIVAEVEAMSVETSWYLAKPCPLPSQIVTVDFLGRLRAPPLATLQMGDCGIGFTVEGHQQPGLAGGGNLAKTLEVALHRTGLV